WTPPQYPKSASDRADIRQTIRHNCLFANLDEQAMSVMIDAMQRFQFKRGKPQPHGHPDEGQAHEMAEDLPRRDQVLMDTTIKQRKLYEAFIDEVPILSELTKYERLTLVDALRPVRR
ncbi:hypothetical protein DYB32_001745, partial [Aphanomyces invadans]